jgi:Cu2+-exporting ATPase
VLGPDDSGRPLQRDVRRSGWLSAAGFRRCRLDSSGAGHRDLPLRGSGVPHRSVGGFVASWATTLGLFNLDFWWELALLIVIMLLGHWLEMRAQGAASGALEALAALLPDIADKITSQGVVEVPVAELAADDVVLVRSGARGPADGVVVSGSAAMDESMITGESRSATRNEGERVVAGTVATDNSIRVRITAVGEETTLAGIQRLVAEAQGSHSRAQALADRAAAFLFYFAAGTGLITFTIWTLLGDTDEAVTRAVTVLVIACPHALGLAIPLVIAIATERAARAGVLVKDRLSLEHMRTVDVVLFDKTGTLTKGSLRLPVLLPTTTRMTCLRWRRRSNPTASIHLLGPSCTPRPQGYQQGGPGHPSRRISVR